ncbi:ubiquitin-like-specific protease 1A [Rosa sericea]
MIFDNEIRIHFDEGCTFFSFKIIHPDCVPVQKNGFDCGIFMIKFMEDYENASKAGDKYHSMNERLRIALTLLKHPDNQARNNIAEARQRSLQKVRCKKRGPDTMKTGQDSTTRSHTDEGLQRSPKKMKAIQEIDAANVNKKKGPGRPRGSKNKTKK